jgi:ribosomal protein S18 acetylase RimI-like enzyme
VLVLSTPAAVRRERGFLEMTFEITIQRAAANDAVKIADMVGELLAEIMVTIGIQAFNFDLAETTDRLIDFLNREKYFVFIARDGTHKPAGFIALYESFTLYAEGAFGTIPELYVRPEFRSNKLGLRLVSQAMTFGSSRSWSRLEVTTPPLPHYAGTLAFYERAGFSITGGRKLKVAL